MSKHSAAVHGSLHNHVVEQEAMGGYRLAQYVAIFTAILSSIAALIGYQSTLKQNEIMTHKNEEIVKNTQAANQWAYFQAKNTKIFLSQLSSELLAGERAKYYHQQTERYLHERKKIKEKAMAMEEAAAKAHSVTEQLSHSHHQLDQSMIWLQMAISLASISVLTTKKWLFHLACASSVIVFFTVLVAVV